MLALPVTLVRAVFYAFVVSCSQTKFLSCPNG
jgi:hypothetical protein